MFRITLLRLFGLFCFLNSVAVIADDGKTAREVSLRTVTLSKPLEDANRLFLLARLSSTGSGGLLILDPNICHLNEFGDETICTKMVPRILPIKLPAVKLADLSGKGRRLYEVIPKHGTLVNRLYLVEPTNPKDSFRFVSEDRGAVRRAVTLEHWDTPSSLTKDRQAIVTFGNNEIPVLTHGVDSKWELGVAKRFYAQQVPGAVLIRAEGETPTGGYEVKLFRLPIRIWPPQHALIWKKPDKPATTAVTPFRVWTAFRSSEKVEEVIVYDRTGRHTVEVEQVPDLTTN